MNEPTATTAEKNIEHARLMARLKAIGQIVASVTALVVAVSALFKPRDDRATQEGYETLAAMVRQVSDDARRNHDDLVALKAYVDGRASHEVTVTAADAGAGDSGVVLTSAATPVVLVPLVRPHAAAPTPSLAPAPKAVEPPPFSKVKKQADMM